jgi:hypothetical protein
VNAAIMQQRRLGNGPFGFGGADFAALQWIIPDLLDGFEAVTSSALILIKWHDW